MQKSFWVENLATVGGVGKAPKAPGTFGTLPALPLVLALSFLGEVLWMLATLVLVMLAVIVASLYEKQTLRHDAKEVVIDEVAGFAVAMLWLPITWQSFLAAFVLFRFFDVVKPPPIRQVDKKVPGGLGVVADDVLAGVFSNLILQWVYWNTGWLGQSL